MRRPEVNSHGAAQLTRIQPALPPQAYQTYAVIKPQHMRPATCAQYECMAYLCGWVLLADEATELGQKQADYIRHDRSRSYQERRTEAGLTEFAFGPGQQGFGLQHRHRLPLSQQRFVIAGGDWRGNPLGTAPRRVSPEAWLDDFGEHQERLADKIQRG